MSSFWTYLYSRCLWDVLEGNLYPVGNRDLGIHPILEIILATCEVILYVCVCAVIETTGMDDIAQEHVV